MSKIVITALVLACALLVSPASGFGQQGDLVSVSRASGGSVQTDLGYGIKINKESNLMREWITVHNQVLPVDLVGTVGVRTTYDSKSRGYRYRASFSLQASEPLAAVEVRFLVFDIWGEHVRTLRTTEIADIDAGQKKLEGVWRILSENECSEHYASIAYVSRVHTQAGRVHAGDTSKVLEEARKFSEKFAETDLEPES